MSLPLVEKAMPAVVATGDYVSLKEHERVTFVIIGASGVVTVSQATAVAGTGAKAVSFDHFYNVADASVTGQLVKTAVASNTFTGTGSIQVVEIDKSDLDIENDFNAVACAFATGTCLAILHDNKVGRVGAQSNPYSD